MADPTGPIAEALPRRFDVSLSRRTLFSALIDAAARYGNGTIALEDHERKPMSYGRLLLGSLVLGRKLAAQTGAGEMVGVMLPSTTGAVVVLMALAAFGRVPALLNFTSGARNLGAAADLAGLKTVLTSRRFVEQAGLDEVIAALSEGRRVVYLEDVRAAIGIGDKLRGVLDRVRARAVTAGVKRRPDDPAMVLFTSGSEGTPKGVVLSNANLLANVFQIRAHAGNHFTTRDIVFSPLPLFHSFGLTAGVFLGLFTGMKVVLYPSPLHYRQVPRQIRETKATLLLATDTFLQGYARAAAPEDLNSVRFVVAGAERVKDETRVTWAAFGTTVLEGYGATECSPVIACNLPQSARSGTVGPLLPGIAHRLTPVEGITEGGRLSVNGPNVMLGALVAGKPGEIAPPRGADGSPGWHDTGDIVSIDDLGLLTIRGRAKRFAKIGGEMVSLAAVEALVAGLWPGSQHVVVSLPDARKGEQLILVTDRAGAERDVLLAHGRAMSVPELWLPKAILVVASVPVLANGKIDHATVVEMAQRNRAML